MTIRSAVGLRNIAQASGAAAERLASTGRPCGDRNALKSPQPGADRRYRTRSSMSQNPHHSVRRIVLPSGRTIEVVRFQERRNRALRRAARLPGVRLGAGASRSIGARRGDAHWELTLECPNCCWARGDVLRRRRSPSSRRSSTRGSTTCSRPAAPRRRPTWPSRSSVSSPPWRRPDPARGLLGLASRAAAADLRRSARRRRRRPVPAPCAGAPAAPAAPPWPRRRAPGPAPAPAQARPWPRSLADCPPPRAC